MGSASSEEVALDAMSFMACTQSQRCCTFTMQPKILHVSVGQGVDMLAKGDMCSFSVHKRHIPSSSKSSVILGKAGL